MVYTEYILYILGPKHRSQQLDLTRFTVRAPPPHLCKPVLVGGKMPPINHSEGSQSLEVTIATNDSLRNIVTSREIATKTTSFALGSFLFQNMFRVTGCVHPVSMICKFISYDFFSLTSRDSETITTSHPYQELSWISHK